MNESSRAARRINLQKNPHLLAQILNRPLTDAWGMLKYSSDRQTGKRAKGLAQRQADLNV